MLLDAVSVKVRPQFQLDIEYENGERRCFDMRPLLTMKPWSKIATPSVFQLARVEYGTVVWPNNIDIAPETLYDDSLTSRLPSLARTTPSPFANMPIAISPMSNAGSTGDLICVPSWIDSFTLPCLQAPGLNPSFGWLR